MPQTENSYATLIRNIEGFIKKHYLNLCLRGMIYFISVAVFLVMFFSLMAYFTWPGILTRSIIFILTITILGSFAFQFIIKPFLSWLKIGKVMDVRTASQLIGSHFPEVRDKLLNTVELEEIKNKAIKAEEFDGFNAADHSLIFAGINQKAITLNRTDFSNAVNLAENRRYLRFVFFPLIMLLLLAFFLPGVLSEGASRIIHFSKIYNQPSPFTFYLKSGFKYESDKPALVQLKIQGKNKPDKVYLIEGADRFPMKNLGNGDFTYVLAGSGTNRTIRFNAAGFYSEYFELVPINRPRLDHFTLRLTYPKSIGIKPEIIKTAGELKIPEGTIAEWTLEGKHIESIILKNTASKNGYKITGNNVFNYKTQLLNDNFFSFIPINNEGLKSDTLKFNFIVMPDNPPKIEVALDSVSANTHQSFNSIKTFHIKISDDYGFSALNVLFQHGASESKDLKTESRNISIKNSARIQELHYSINPGFFLKMPGNSLSVWFEVRDNNKISGPNLNRSEKFVFSKPSLFGEQENLSKNGNAISVRFHDLEKMASILSSEAKGLKEKLANSASLSYEDKRQAENLLNKETEFQENLQKFYKEASQKHTMESENGQSESKEELSKRIAELTDPETLKLLEQLKQMLGDNNRNAIRNGLQKVEDQEHNRTDELKRLNELYKNELLSRQNELLKEQLQNLAKDEKELSLSQKENKKIKDQEKITQDFEKALSMEKELSKSANRKSLQENEQRQVSDTRKDLSKSSADLKKQNSKQASKDEQQASKEMEDLASKMEEVENQEQSEETKQDLSSIRMILENLLRVSFSQENVMTRMSSLQPNDPSYRELVRKEYDLKDDLHFIQDSVSSLAKKIPQIQGFVNKEFNAVNQNMKTVVQLLSDHHMYEAAGRQQFVMTAVNNLAVLLSNTENQLQKAMQNAAGKGKGKKNAGKSALSLEKLMELQKGLNGEIEKRSETGKQSGQSSETYAKLAARQEEIRRDLQKLLNDQSTSIKKAGNEAGKTMEQTELDLLNKKSFSPALNSRQKQIMTHMLEAQNAEKEQEQDNERESKTGKDSVLDPHIAPFSFIAPKNVTIPPSQLTSPSPGINSFYKTKINSYFDHLNEGR